MSGIDVLAVLDELVADMGDTPGTTGHQVAQARDAVDELIEAAVAVDATKGSTSPERIRLRLALARCRGAER